MILPTWMKPVEHSLSWVRAKFLWSIPFFILLINTLSRKHLKPVTNDHMFRVYGFALCFSFVGLKDDFQTDVFKMLSGILHLGNVVIKSVRSDQSSVSVSKILAVFF